MSLIIGIDPGKTGAVAFLEHDDSGLEGCRVRLIKDTPVVNGEFDLVEMRNLLKESMGFTLNPYVFIEKVHAMPKQGVCSMFNFGMGYGMWLGMLAGLELQWETVIPQRWKKELLDGLKDKDDARLRAKELYPKAHDLLYRKKDIGRADALLIAEYGRRKLYGNAPR